MSEDEDSPPQPPSAGRAAPRGRLASSTLGALRAGRSGAPAHDDTDQPDEVAGDEVAGDEVAGDEVAGDEVAGDEVAGDEVAGDESARAAGTGRDTTAGDETARVATVDGEAVELRKAGRAPADEMPTLPVAARATSDSPEDASEPAGAPRRSGRGGWITAACASLTVAALVFAVVAGVVWWTAGHSGQHRLGVARDQVSTDARLAIVTVNTSDYRQPDAALANWLDVSTGALHSQFAQSRTAAVKLLAEAKMITRANVLDAAVTSVDLSKGKASVIASVNVTRTPVSGSVTTVRNRFRATLTRVGGSWKLSNLAVVPVSLS